MKSNGNPLFSSSSYPQYWDFIHQILDCFEEKLFMRQDAAEPGQSGHVGFAGQVSPVL
jgi:hypothetical protein